MTSFSTPSHHHTYPTGTNILSDVSANSDISPQCHEHHHLLKNHAVNFERDIEPCKENMQPVRAGRFNLKQLVSTNQKQRSYQLECYEKKISQNPKDLNSYIECIHFLKKSTLDLSSDKKYRDVLKRATEVLSITYKDDIRMLRLWLMYLDLEREPLEAFRWMEANSVGVKFADFWLRWARYIEDQGDYPGAQKLLEMGIEREAKPIHKLKKRQEDYFKRVVHRIKNGVKPQTEQSAAPALPHAQRVMTLAQCQQSEQNSVARKPFDVIQDGFSVAGSGVENQFRPPLHRKRKRQSAPLQGLESNTMKKMRTEEDMNIQIFADEDESSSSSGQQSIPSILAPSQSKRFGFSILSDTTDQKEGQQPIKGKSQLTGRSFVPLQEQTKENQQTIQKLLPDEASALLVDPTSQQKPMKKIKKKIVSKKKKTKKLGSKKSKNRLKIYQDKSSSSSSSQGISKSMSRLML